MTPPPVLGWALAAVGPLLWVAVYGLAWARCRRRDVDWPPGRLLAAVAAAAVGLVALSPPVVAATDRFPGHVLQHLLLTMLAPMLAVLAAPVTLLLRAAPPVPRRALVGVLHGRWLRVVSTPVVLVASQVLPTVLLYLTPALHELHSRPLLHLLVHAHMVAAGLVFAAVLVPADPMPRRPGVGVRVALLVVVAGAHDAVARLVYARAGSSPLGEAGEVRAGAELLSAGSAVLEVALAICVMGAWYAAGGRALRAQQRRAELLGGGSRGVPAGRVGTAGTPGRGSG